MLAWILAGLWVAALSVVALGLTLFDKARSRTRGLRIRERTLLLLALVGGSPGLALGMVLARHKTRKPGFLAKFLAIVLAQALLAWILVAR